MNYRIIHPVRVIFIVLALVFLITTAFFFQNYSSEIINWVNHLGWFAPLLFLIIYCFATVMFLPTMVITLAGGALFGPFFGTLLNLLGATSGAAVSFLITRHLVYDWFSQRKGKRLRKLISAVEQRGWMIVALLRLFPIVPFNIVNYGLGITAIKFRSYLMTTFIFLIPAEIVYTYFGYAGMEALLKQGAFYKNKEILIAGLVVVLLCIIKLLHLNNFRFKYSKKQIID
ncbi:putative integral inner membrane protein [Legionella steigerwaltii]|uniref:TVP38/TMEM64 family membrane protein n=1 Tax=Legionella steigerwaltii TaxID=460 RepID=A0A378L8L4_9GAMM|nr:TVP38/TMEM64 family protein [Legionella steigerwaltii]KTD77303.1 putative integral inner membrane protein [Legionella steigerwaltii]STY22029.1 putative integral inner membrane protein [Legionella steigerwaltii]